MKHQPCELPGKASLTTQIESIVDETWGQILMNCTLQPAAKISLIKGDNKRAPFVADS
jgi:hypothetical protein